MQNPRQYKIPDWFLNRQKDVKDGKYSQVRTGGAVFSGGGNDCWPRGSPGRNWQSFGGGGAVGCSGPRWSSQAGGGVWSWGLLGGVFAEASSPSFLPPQVLANGLDNKLREDLERLKKIRAHRGLRHFWG